MAILIDTDELARDFVNEYLDRTPEYGDVSEFMWDTMGFDGETLDSDDVSEVYGKVIVILDTIAQRYADSEN